MTEDTRSERIIGLVQETLMLLLIAACIWFVWAACYSNERRPGGDEAVVLMRGDAVSALWQYQQLPMKECRWCRRTVNLNRHHIVPQAANPVLRDVRENLIVLCRDCHFVLGHRCDWKQYNPDVMYIATHFTNCIRSADTRTDGEQQKSAKPDAGDIDCTDILHVTNNVPESQRAALERILRSGTDSHDTDRP